MHSSGSVGPPQLPAHSGSNSQLVGSAAAAAAGGSIGVLPESCYKGVQWSVTERKWQAFWLNRAANEVSWGAIAEYVSA
jgi:hypothetical protein